MFAKDQTFKNVDIYLDGGSFYDCIFKGCKITLTGQMPFTLVGCNFDSCQWAVAGLAGETLKILTILYQAGAAEMIETTFDAIRGKKPGGPTLH